MYKIFDEKLPVIGIEDFIVPTDLEKDEIKKIIFEEKKKFEESGLSALPENIIRGKTSSKKYYNFTLTQDYNNFFKNLYDGFFKQCEDIFGDLKAKSDNRRIVWAFCSNKDFFIPFWHDHLHCSTIAGVYYFAMPDKENGFIDFSHQDTIYRIYPKEYQLLIFPNFLPHKPNRIQTEDYRIAFNMEILSHRSSSLLFSKFNSLNGFSYN